MTSDRVPVRGREPIDLFVVGVCGAHPDLDVDYSRRLFIREEREIDAYL